MLKSRLLIAGVVAAAIGAMPPLNGAITAPRQAQADVLADPDDVGLGQGCIHGVKRPRERRQ